MKQNQILFITFLAILVFFVGITIYSNFKDRQEYFSDQSVETTNPSTFIEPTKEDADDLKPRETSQPIVDEHPANETEFELKQQQKLILNMPPAQHTIPIDINVNILQAPTPQNYGTSYDVGTTGFQSFTTLGAAPYVADMRCDGSNY